MYPALDQEIIGRINSLTPEEVSRKVSYAFEHELMWYGIDALAHYLVMNEAKDLSFDDLSKKFGIGPSRYRTKPFSVSLQAIQSNGVFIPIHAYSNLDLDRKIVLFDVDYENCIDSKDWKNQEYAFKLTGRTWSAKDFEKPRIVSSGIRFAKDLWQDSVNGFEKNQAGQSCEDTPQPSNVTELGRKLIAYYSEIIK